MELTRLICLGPLALLLAGPAFGSGETLAAQGATEGAAQEESVEAPTASAGQVVRAIFTSSIAEREPVDSIEQLAADRPGIVFFTELRDFGGQTVTHRWERDGEIMAEVPFQVGADRWRVWSSKRLLPDWTGEWTVSVIDEAGSVVESRSFHYGAAGTAAAPETETTPPSAETAAEPAMEAESSPAAAPATEP